MNKFGRPRSKSAIDKPTVGATVFSQGQVVYSYRAVLKPHFVRQELTPARLRREGCAEAGHYLARRLVASSLRLDCSAHSADAASNQFTGEKKVWLAGFARGAYN